MKTRLFVLAGATAALLVAAGGVALASQGADDRPAAPVAVTAPGGTAPGGTAPAPALDRAAAERIAVDHVGGGRVTDDSELEWEHGALVWEVEVNDTRDLDVDATTGEVRRDRTDD